MGTRLRGIFSFLGKRISPFDPQEKGIRLAVWSSNNLYASGMKISARGIAAFSVAIRFASAPIIRCCAAVGGSAALRMRHTPCGCRSADLVGVQTNFRLLEHSTMRRAPAMPLFRTQSAAKQTSLAPHDSKARLIPVTNRRRFMAKPCTPHLHCAARAALQDKNCQCAGSRGKPPCLSLGVPKGVFSLEREYPLCPASPRQWDRTPRPLGIQKENTAFAV